MKTTLLLSLTVHGLFFSTALLFSAGLMQGSRSVPGERIIYVDLAEERERTEIQPALLEQEAMVHAKAKPSTKKERTVLKKAANTERAPTEDDIRKSAQERVPVKDGVREEPELSAGPGAENHQAAGSVSLAEDAGGVPEAEHEGKGQTVAASHVPHKAEVESGSAGDGLPSDIIAVIERAIERAKTYPLIARKRGIEGTVHVRFLINPRGEPQEIEILKSSGHGILDAATVKVVRKAAPYPRVDRRVEVPVAYRLKD